MEYKEDEEYLLLNFTDKLDQKFFEKPNLFFKIVNLDTKSPFVQIGNHIFSAKYDEVLGTSLIFGEDAQQETNIYDRQTQIPLKYLGKTCKSLSLQYFKIPDELPGIEENELVELEFIHNYDTVMKLLETGSLDIKDIIKKPCNETPIPRPKEPVHPEQEKTSKAYNQFLAENQCPPILNDLLKADIGDDCYNLLKDLVHHQVQDPEYYSLLEGDEFTSYKQYQILKEIYLKNCNFERIGKVVKNPVNYVDVQASIRDGIIKVKSKLSDDDMRKLFSMDNFDNFSIELKIIVLTDYLKEQKAEMKKQSTLELQKEDEFGHTAKQRYRMVRSFVKDLKYLLMTKTEAVKK